VVVVGGEAEACHKNAVPVRTGFFHEFTMLRKCGPSWD